MCVFHMKINNQFGGLTPQFVLDVKQKHTFTKEKQRRQISLRSASLRLNILSENLAIQQQQQH